MITAHQITVFNRVIDKNTATQTYKSTKLRAYMPISYQTQGVNGVASKVKTAKAYMSITLYGSKYRGPSVFDKLIDPKGYFTLKLGDKIARGWHNSLEEANEVYTIENVEIYDVGKLPHFVITAK